MKSIFLISFLFIGTVIGCQKEEGTLHSFWETIDPENAGFSSDSITFALSNAEKLNNFYSLIVLKGGKIAAEGYFNGKRESSHFHLRSITKSVVSVLTGIAIDKSFLRGSDQPLSEIFTGIDNDRLESITVGHLLTMSSGVEWDEEKDVIEILEHRGGDPMDIFLTNAQESEAGLFFKYSTLSTHILGLAIAEASKLSLEQFAQQHLFEPLGIDSYRWERDVKGRVWGSTGLQLKARDLAKIGLMVMNEGIWKERQVISSSWVNEMIKSQISIQGSGSSYGYQWWISNNLDYQLIFGQGFGGQSLMLIPEKEIIIIGLQEHFVGFENSAKQWNSFLRKVFYPIYNSIDQ